MTRIYTGTGDAGDTSLFDGQRVRKSHARVAAYGDVDELNACLGAARAIFRHGPGGLDGRVQDLDEALEGISRDLFALGALLADPRRDEGSTATWTAMVLFGDDKPAALERLIDRWEKELPELTAFILPGGTEAAAALHVARAVARRAERSLVILLDAGGASRVALVYLNRLADLLFVAARLANKRLGVADVPWKT